ncbi:DegT/DnrJ/EryC1/StrS family aminotransferase [Sediminibacterium ginsengisoli]|uniref:Perosamine synthetase n=1 Tax=Sediminibacterium ginsengisoli TaxID=413434 RepID=A0A1T4N5E5_9BACT|nr:DegT/DnrJ/EryC1/StrS family aminotransferase [Sediminibacterium ginsengisoli]SJZ74331.1 perosamine synthetase [Sediminibacterium ginsengisoli]
MSNKINWYNFSFWGNEKQYVNEALDSTWISGGTYIEKFENALCEKMKLPNAFVVANGTAALHLAFLTIGIQPGDEVIVPSFGFLAAANVLKLMEATPVFVDIDENNWCLDSNLIQKSVTKKTKAIVIIHNYGIIADMLRIKQIAADNNIVLVEDCAESIFSKYDNKYCGQFGDISTFSFHATKTIATGEGGMVCCRNEELTDKLKLIRSHGLRRKKKHYWHEYFGHNFRLSNILAAIGFGQLEHADEIIEAKQRIWDRYKINLQDNSMLKFQQIPEMCNPIVWAIAVWIDVEKNGKTRDEILTALSKKGIECRPGFYTAWQLPIYEGQSEVNFEVANRIASNIIVLPSYPKMTDGEIDFVSEALVKIVSE